MAASSEQPYASVILLTKNGAQTIIRCLDAIFGQQTEFPFEVVAIDSGSTDGTIEVLNRYPVILRKIPSERFNFGATKNLGVSISKGQVVIFLSQDAIPLSDDWLQKMAGSFSDPGMMVVQGVEVSSDDGFYWWSNGHFWFTSEIQRWMEEYHDIGLSCVSIAIRKEAFERIRFDEVPFGEDKLFQKKAVDAGLRIQVARDAIVEHTHRYSLKSLVERVVNEGLGARISGGEYSLRDAIGDSFNVRVIGLLFDGLRSGRVRSLGELLYPFLRPIGVYVGWHQAKSLLEPEAP